MSHPVPLRVTPWTGVLRRFCEENSNINLKVICVFWQNYWPCLSATDCLNCHANKVDDQSSGGDWRDIVNVTLGGDFDKKEINGWKFCFHINDTNNSLRIYLTFLRILLTNVRDIRDKVRCTETKSKLFNHLYPRFCSVNIDFRTN